MMIHIDPCNPCVLHARLRRAGYRGELCISSSLNTKHDIVLQSSLKQKMLNKQNVLAGRTGAECDLKGMLDGPG